MRFLKFFSQCLVGGILSLALVVCANAEEGFVVKSIRVQGTTRIAESTVISYLPIKVGETVTANNSPRILSALYATGFFQDIKMGHQGNVLIIQVVERQTIGSVNVTGNKTIKKDDLAKLLKDSGLVEGKVFSNVVLERTRQAMLAHYNAANKYNVIISPKVVPQANNTVAVTLDVSEGGVAKVRGITIEGNHVFSSKVLRKQLLLTKPGLLTFFTKTDQYSKDKLEASLEILRSYYMDRGYIRFNIDSSDVTMSPDKKNVYITVHVTEGPQYTLKGYKFTGNLIFPEEKLREVSHLKIDCPFSKAAVVEATKNIGDILGSIGYAFAVVNPVPDVNDETREVILTFFVNPGPRVYVRRINFAGNTTTADYVLRRAVQQNEGGLMSSVNIQESVRQLNLLGYFKNARVDTKPVAGVSNQVDVTFLVDELENTGSATFSAGYGTNGFLINAGITQQNFLGTGRTVALQFANDRFSRSLNFTYFNPYYMDNGIGRGINLFVQKSTPYRIHAADYSYDTAGANVYYTVPLALNDQLQFGYGYKYLQLHTESSRVSREIREFIRHNGEHFHEIMLNGNWRHIGQDRAIFPTQGFNQMASAEISLPFIGTPLEYYKIDYKARLYVPLSKSRNFIFTTDGGVGYGNGYGRTRGLPFMMNYFAGGVGTDVVVRGYETNSLGPEDSRGNNLGGNFMVHGSAGLIFPTFISPQTLRTTAFVDAGNVFQTGPAPATFKEGGIRFSVGIAAEWRSPLGPMVFSLAQPLNANKHDVKYPFQFTAATSF